MVDNQLNLMLTDLKYKDCKYILAFLILSCYFFEFFNDVLMKYPGSGSGTKPVCLGLVLST